jgi:hypothetical protein
MDVSYLSCLPRGSYIGYVVGIVRSRGRVVKWMVLFVHK